MSDTSLISFKAITSFTNALAELFADQQRSLKLYCHLISKTTLAHDKAITKHISAFREFCISNREALSSKDIKKFKQHRVEYSNKVYIDLNAVFKIADMETRIVIWSHLLTIAALVDPAGKAKEILKKNVSGSEGDFLSDIITKVEQNVDPNAPPMEVVANIMKSGIFNDLIGGMQNGLNDGSMDLGKLMGSVQKMVTSLGEQTGGNEDGDQAMNMINTMMGSMTGGLNNTTNDNSQADGMPDMSAMLGPMMKAFAGGSGGGIPNLSEMMSDGKDPTPNVEEIE
jgi:hypothetical protein